MQFFNLQGILFIKNHQDKNNKKDCAGKSNKMQYSLFKVQIKYENWNTLYVRVSYVAYMVE